MDKNKYAVIANNVNKCYKMYSGPKEKLLDLLLPNGRGKEFRALKNISFKVEKGEIVGLLGLNGAGKSTLSNILGGVSIPTEGTIDINGESSVIAIGLGLNNFLTGIENIKVKATMMGYKKADIERITKEVIEFAEIGDFINQPIRTYSSGMRSRLGFGIAVNMSPDILVIDEALSVGDPTFAQKCLDKMNEFKNSGKTIFFVSHSLPQIKEFCTKAMWLEYGVLKEYGDIETILPKYAEYIKKINSMSEKEKKEYKATVLKEQEHGLLGDFKYKSFNFDSLDFRGKIIKQTIISNGIKAEKINYNFDLMTAIFGFMPSLFRHNLIEAASILCCQLLNLFIMSIPVAIFINFIITSSIAVFTGKRYVKKLILNKGYKAVKFDQENDDINKIKITDSFTVIGKLIKKIKIKNKFKRERNFKINKKQKIIISLVSVIIVIIISGFSYFKLVEINKSINRIDLNKLTQIIIETDEKGKEKIDSIAIAKKSEEKNLDIKVYPGDLVIKNDKYMTLSNLMDYKNVNSIRTMMKNSFNEDIKDYVIIKDNEIIKDSLDYHFELVESLNEGKELTNVIDSSIENEKFKNINQFYLNSEKISIKDVEYKEKKLEEIYKENNIEIPNKFNYKDYKLKYLDEAILKDEKILNALKNLR